MNQSYAFQGHKNGQVLVWEDLNYKMELCNYKYDILSIVNCEFGIIVATESSTLHFVTHFIYYTAFYSSFRNAIYILYCSLMTYS